MILLAWFEGFAAAGACRRVPPAATLAVTRVVPYKTNRPARIENGNLFN
jgi:hypothetical protein